MTDADVDALVAAGKAERFAPPPPVREWDADVEGYAVVPDPLYDFGVRLYAREGGRWGRTARACPGLVAALLAERDRLRAALAAERERAAKIAESLNTESGDVVTRVGGWLVDAVADVRAEIAAAIRSGEG